MKNTLRPILLLAVNLIFFGLSTICTLHAQIPVINTFAGNGSTGFSGDGGPATNAAFDTPSGIAIDAAGNVYIADELNHRIRKVHAGIISTLAGSGPHDTLIGYFYGDGGPANLARLNAPFGVAVDAAGNVYIADNQNFRIRKVNTSGIISTIGGTGVSGYTGDGLAATSARISYTQGLATDPSGNVYLSDVGNHVVRKITPAGIISTVAGKGMAGFSGDGGPADSAQLNTPRGLKTDAAGNIYIADYGNDRVRKVNPAGIIITIAGGGPGGLGVPATAATLSGPGDIALDAAGNLYISCELSFDIRKVSTSDTIRHLAGVPPPTPLGDGCAAATAGFFFPRYLAIDGAGNLYISDVDQGRVRIISNNHTPSFAGGHSLSITMCSDAMANLDSILAIIDSDQQQPETWTALPAAHGTALVSYAGISGVGITNPAGTWYTPSPGYVGSDLFSVIITDCVGTADTTTVYVNVANCSLGTVLKSSGGSPGLSVYPNPNGGAFTCYISAAASLEVRLVITNVLGEQVQEVMTSANAPTYIQLDQPPGVYFLSARTSDGTFNEKILVR